MPPLHPRLDLVLRYYKNLAQGRLWPELRLLTALVDATGKGNIIDVGANIGLFTYHFARRGWPVEAFEPLPWCASSLLRARLPGVTVHECALADRDGWADLFVPTDGTRRQSFAASLTQHSTAFEQLTVTTRTLDSFSFRNVALIKIDVEGHEWPVVAGAIGTLKAEKPLLHIEIEQRHLGEGQSVVAIVDRICSLGYRGYMLQKGRPVPTSQFSFARHQQPFISSVQRHIYAPDYVNNFLFVDPDSRALDLLGHFDPSADP